MKLRVKLGSALPEKFPGYDSRQGLDIDISDDATVQDLLDYLQLTESDKCAIAVEGRIVKGDYKLKGVTSLNIFQVAHGG